MPRKKKAEVKNEPQVETAEQQARTGAAEAERVKAIAPALSKGQEFGQRIIDFTTMAIGILEKHGMRWDKSKEEFPDPRFTTFSVKIGSDLDNAESRAFLESKQLGIKDPIAPPVVDWPKLLHGFLGKAIL